MLKDYVKTSNITTYSQLNFFSGVDIERYYSLFDPLPSDLIINTEDDDLLILYDNLSI
jgi:hypothetical protein